MKVDYDSILKDYPFPESVKEEIKKELKEAKLTKAQAKKVVERCFQVYLKNLMEPGEAAGIVAAQSIGEPGTQMSLPYDERIIIKEGENVRIVEIGKLVDECITKYGCIKQGIHEICDLPVDIYALSLDRDEKVRWKPIKSVIRHRFKGKLIRIKTRSGRVITATPYHSFVIRCNNEIVPIEGLRLKIGDRIPVIRFMPLNCISIVDLSKFVSYPVVNSYIAPINGRPIPKEINLDFELGYFLGVYLADGYATKYFVSISNTSEEVIEAVRSIANRFNLSFAEYVNQNGFSESKDIRIYSAILSEFVKSFGTNARDKRIPDFVFSADREFVRGLLQGYFDGDGSVNVDRKTIRVYSSSKDLIDGISLLLTRFGIFSVKRKMRNQFGLEISYRYAKKFAEEIGSSIPDKSKKLSEIANSLKDKKTYDLIDMIPSFGLALLKASKKLGYPLHYARRFTRKQKIGRATLQRHLANLEEIAKTKGIKVEELEVLKRALNSDVIWDEIVSIEYVDYDGYVYDLSVDGLETFTTAEGVITHNTMRTFHYAGVAEINVTLGLPRLIEILDVRKNPSTPMMTIRLLPEYAKDREKAREVANRIEATYVKDVADIEVDLRNMRIIIKPDEKTLKKKDLTIENLKNKIEKSIKTEVFEEGKNLVIQIEKPSYKVLMETFEKVKNTLVSGIKEIKRVIIRREDDEYVLYTEGSNLKKVMKVKGVDFTRTLTNNIYEIYEVLGIEAARNAIIREAINTLEEQGLEVDVRHIMLVADVMTADGELKQIGRHGVAGEKQSILARAAFEMTVNNLLEAAVKGEVDYLKGITENIIVGQPIKLGTGDVELRFKMGGKK